MLPSNILGKLVVVIAKLRTRVFRREKKLLNDSSRALKISPGGDRKGLPTSEAPRKP